MHKWSEQAHLAIGRADLVGSAKTFSVSFSDLVAERRETQLALRGGFSALVDSAAAPDFVAAVHRRRTISWLPEGQAATNVDALFVALRQAAVIADWPVEGEPPAPTEMIDYSELAMALDKIREDESSMAFVEGNAGKLERGMRVYASRVDLSLSPTPW